MPEIGNKITKADIDLVDETFEPSHSESYHLSIQTEPGRLSFCVFNTVIQKYVVLRNYPLSITDPHGLVSSCSSIFENDDLLGLVYKSSSLLWISPRCTLVPCHLFDSNEPDSYLSFTHGAMTGEQTQQNFIRPANLYNVFSCPEALIDILRRYHPHIRLIHQVTPLIRYIVTGTSSTTDKADVAVFFYSGYLDIVIGRKHELLFYNTYPINAPEDSVYYLAGVANMFDIDLSSTNLIYAGDINQMPPEIAIFRDYVARIIECKPSDVVIYSHFLIQTPVLRNFINLFNLYGCEL